MSPSTLHSSSVGVLSRQGATLRRSSYCGWSAVVPPNVVVELDGTRVMTVSVGDVADGRAYHPCLRSALAKTYFGRNLPIGDTSVPNINRVCVALPLNADVDVECLVILVHYSHTRSKPHHLESCEFFRVARSAVAMRMARVPRLDEHPRENQASPRATTTRTIHTTLRK